MSRGKSTFSQALSQDLEKRVLGSMTGKFQKMKVPTTFDMSKFLGKIMNNLCRTGIGANKHRLNCNRLAM
jgi:hypothetical protein